MPAGAWQQLKDERNINCVSAASVWECAVKFRLNRGAPDDMPFTGTDALREFRNAGFQILDITAEHAAAVDHLPLHHRDPFDRLMVAQARLEPLLFFTHDKNLSAYGDFVKVV
jgi:PIN domain nuclease of toxin-antitoxin system